MKVNSKLFFKISLLTLLVSGCSPSSDNGITDDYPKVSMDGTTLTYGYYPQSVIHDNSLISALDKLKAPTNNGWYLYKNNYYVKYNATPHFSNTVFDNNEVIISGTPYWFKCEPINWKILSSKNGQYLVASEMALDPCEYYSSLNNRTIGGKTVYPNNYEHSYIREWLNDNFYNSAFRFNNSYIQTTNVDNSAYSTKTSSNPYYSNNTSDKVFLLSYQEYKNRDYGFTYDYLRGAKTSEWARARGAYVATLTSAFKDYGHLWTRSPYSEYATHVHYINSDGYIESASTIEKTYYSVRPAMNIRIA